MDAPMTLDEVRTLYDRPAYVVNIEEQTDSSALSDAMKAGKNVSAKSRVQAILDTALSVGIKSGIAWQLRNIQNAINRRAREFDTVYDFGHLLIRDRVVPPVITEAKDLYSQDGDLALRLSGAYYKIERQARFTSVAPNWREYLTFPKATLDQNMLANALKPRDRAERKVWELAVTDGWRQGVEQANLMLTGGLDRLNRDFTGMMRFHTFEKQGKIMMPAVATESIAVTKEGRTMAVDETLLRITALPDFSADTQRWSGVIRSSSFGMPTRTVTVPKKKGKVRKRARTPDYQSGISNSVPVLSARTHMQAGSSDAGTKKRGG